MIVKPAFLIVRRQYRETFENRCKSNQNRSISILKVIGLETIVLNNIQLYHVQSITDEGFVGFGRTPADHFHKKNQTMATNYQKITQENEHRYGTETKHLSIYKRLYGDKTHFVYELIQNADDNKSRHLELQLGEDEKELFVWNDGCQFSEEDVYSICSIGSSNKDLTQIGTFGIGFKAVYNYTDFPEIYSGEERFRIRDLTKPERIDEITPQVIEQIDKGRTVFRLPFKDSLRQEDIEDLKNRLCNLEKRALLFLRHLKKIQWRDTHDTQTGSYSCHRHPHDKIQDASEIELMASINSNNQPSETFLVFHKEVRPPQDVINELLQQAEDEEEQQRIQRSAKKQQPVEVAFKLHDGQITAMDDSCKLFAYLPTKKETHLRFLIQGRYQTTPARDNIPKETESPWNKWLVQETAYFLPEVLEQLKEGGLLEPAFFNVVPLIDDNIPEEFEPIAKVLRKAMKNRLFVPTQNGGYAKAESVFYPHAEPLRKLFKISWLHPNSYWLHPEIRDTEKSRRCFKVMHEAGVKEVRVSQILSWLEKRSPDWFRSRSNKWLRSLYNYLNRRKDERERIKNLPLVRLENGQQVCTSDQLVFFPPEADEAREEITPFLKDLPILNSALLEGDEHNDIEAFLKSLGVRPLRPADMIRECILPQYSQGDKPSVKQNRLHLHYLFKVWDKIPPEQFITLKEEISQTPILRAYSGTRREAFDFVKPCDVYLPQAYTGNADLETYFSVCDDVWFVDDKYLDSKSVSKGWIRFLKEIGAVDKPRVIEESLPANDEECKKRDIGREYSTRSATIEDSYFHGLPAALAEISEQKKIDISHALWYLLVKALPSEKWRRDTFFQGTYRWFYRRRERDSFDATFYRQLKETTWLPDEQGNLHYPSECFAPTSENRRLLGDSVTYLHPDFDISQNKESARWLAEKLGVHLNANTESVLNYLQILSSTEVSVKKVEPLYRFLDRQDARPREKFREESLIFTPTPEPRWWRTNEVFWEDECLIFGNGRGYLKDHYPETLKSFFTALGVRERAAPLDYVRGIQDITSGEQAGDEDVRNRVKILYSRLWLSIQEGGNWLEDEEWEQTREDKCWLGKKGNEWDFFYWEELVWKDHEYIASLFEGKVPFWAFDELLDLAKNIEVEGCSQAEVKFHPGGDQEEYECWSKKVRNLSTDIQAFLKSPRLCNKEYEDVKSVQVLNQLSVRLVEELRTTYKLKGITVSDPEPRPSFLDITDQEVSLWLGLAADDEDYPELIGDALQDYFDVKELRGFIEDLLTKDRNKVLNRWQQRGLQTDFCVSPSQTGSNEGEEKPSGTSDEGSSDGTEGEDDGSIPRPEGVDGTRSSGGHRGGSSGGGNGGHGGGGGGGEGEAHRKLKKHLAHNPSQLSKGLKLVKIEHQFNSGDKVDILLEDSSGNPVTVEVETGFSSGNGRYVGVWQAVKYKHLAAVEYGLSCDQVRGILAAPKIPDDVKKKCEQLEIDPKQVSI